MFYEMMKEALDAVNEDYFLKKISFTRVRNKFIVHSFKFQNYKYFYKLFFRNFKVA
jgi:hypothetical protein